MAGRFRPPGGALMAVAAAVTVLVAASAPAAALAARPQAPGPVGAAFADAAARFHVPESLLLAAGWVNSHWRMERSRDGGWGVMHVGAAGGDSLARGSRLSGLPVTAIETDLAANVSAGAALLAAAAGEPRPAGLAGWYSAVARTGGGDAFADQVFQVLRRGATGAAASGERLAVAPQPGLAPSGARAGASGDYPPAAWVPASPANYTASSRPPSEIIDKIVIHVTQASYAATLSWFQNPAAQASAHYVVRSSDGAVAQTVAEHDIAWHAGNWDYNTRSVGIEHEGFVDDPSWFTDAMYRSSAQLAASLARRYAIPVDRLHIVGHDEVPDPDHPGLTGGRDHHTDPGPYWDWGRYMALVAAYAGSYCAEPSGPWTQVPGAAYDVGAGGAAVWVIGTDPEVGGYGIYDWNGSGWTAVDGAAVRIAVGPDGTPWVVNVDGGIFRRSPGGWSQLPGEALDIGVGPDGVAWVIGTNPVGGGYGIWRWDGYAWTSIPGGGVRIAAGPRGLVWIVNDVGSIYHRTGSGWVQVPGSAYDVASRPDGSPAVIGVDRWCGGYGVWTWGLTSFAPAGGGAIGIAAGGDGRTWVVNDGQGIFFRS